MAQDSSCSINVCFDCWKRHKKNSTLCAWLALSVDVTEGQCQCSDRTQLHKNMGVPVCCVICPKGLLHLLPPWLFLCYYWSAPSTTTAKTLPAASLKSELKQFAACLHFVKPKMKAGFLLSLHANKLNRPVLKHVVSETSDQMPPMKAEIHFWNHLGTAETDCKGECNIFFFFFRFFPGHHFWIYLVLAPCLPLDQMNCPVGPKECRVGIDIKPGSLIGPLRPPFARMEG